MRISLGLRPVAAINPAASSRHSLAWIIHEPVMKERSWVGLGVRSHLLVNYPGWDDTKRFALKPIEIRMRSGNGGTVIS